MRGRYEKPRKGRRAQNPVPNNPDPREVYQDSYEDTGYSQDPYSQEGYGSEYSQQNQYYESAYEQAPEADDYSEYSGNPYGQNQFPQSGNSGRREGSGIGWGLLCFFFPLLGLILFLAWKRSRPRAAKASGIGGLTGLIVQLVLLLVLIIGGSMYYNHILDKVNIVEMTKPVYTEAPTEPMITEAPTETTEATEAPTTEPPTAQREDFINILIVGQASRANEEERFADTMLVCTLNKFDNSITVTSLLRDSFVKPPAFRGHNFGRIKLTTVYHLGSHYDNGNVAGSMELINNTLYSNFGLEIDYNVEVSFEIFEDVVNALGGVDIELNEAECDYLNDYLQYFDWTDYHVEPGMNHLDGFASLAYARMRKADGDGESDIKRTARQRKFMEVLMQKVKTMNINDLQNIIDMVLPQITTNMSKSEISDMIKTVLPMLPGMEFKSGGTCPANYSGVMEDIYDEGIYHSVLKFNENETKQHMRELTLGEVPGSK